MGPKITVDGTLNAAKQLTTLKEYVIPEIASSELCDVRFIHDNAPCYKANLVIKFLEDNQFNKLK